MSSEYFWADHGFVLHRYPYRETSFIIELFTQHQGKVSVVAKGVRRPKSALKGLLQPFMPLQINAKGKGALKNLTLAELHTVPLQLNNNTMISGLYLNELLVRLLPKDEPCQHLYTIYYATLLRLASQHQASNFVLERSLRLFEKNLLIALGYALPLSYEANTNHAIQADQYYRFIPEHGFELCAMPQLSHSKNQLFTGAVLLAIEHDQFDDPAVLAAAKRLMRLAFAPLLGNKPLKSRELFNVIDNL